MRSPWSVCIAVLASLMGQVAPAPCANNVLEGRIEAIVKSNTTLPAPVLKMQVPLLDNGTTIDGSGKVLSTGISNPNYPDYLIGKWGGELKTTWTQTVSTHHIPDEFILGSRGKVVFEFVKNGLSGVLKPARVYFPSHMISHEEFLLVGVRPEKMAAADLREQNHKTFTKLDLNQSRLFRSDGSTSELVVALNEMKTLRRGIVEQDMVVREYEDRKFYGYRETVMRFTWHRKNLIFAEIGIVKYDKSGKINSRSIMQGWLTPNWQKVADEVSSDYGLSWEKIEQYGVPNAGQN